MCGIAGILNLREGPPPSEPVLRQMLGMIRHRGPDAFGIFLGKRVGLGSARLSIIDLEGGQQPIGNEDGSCWVVFNGEIFNHPELREELERRGHRFVTRTDTEVLVHLYEEEGLDLVKRLNGQFAFALWDGRKQRLFLARDRVGVRPLFFAEAEGKLIFASEIKSLLAEGTVAARLDPGALSEVFTYWSTLSPGSAFLGVREVSPGHGMVVEGGALRSFRYWRADFDQEDHAIEVEEAEEALLELLEDSTRIRLRADVPVGAYLSGGLDSSLIAALARRQVASKLETFSVTFEDPRFDESSHQLDMARFLGTEHHVLHASHEDIGRIFPELIWHVETPILRTAPAPMFLLSRLVRDSGFKVVLTGEGADEFLAGYDIFKEARIRRFWARRPASQWRPSLLRRLYGDITTMGRVNPEYLKAFFGVGLEEVEDPGYTHAVRWRNTGRACRLLSPEARAAGAGRGGDWMGALPEHFAKWGTMERAQHLEIVMFLSQYLLCSQGDRPAMAHSVEGRFPFLDARVMEFCQRLPSRLKSSGLKEKYLLRRVAKRFLPAEVWSRPKRPYRAPIQASFLSTDSRPYVAELLSEARLRETGLFHPPAVQLLWRRAESGAALGESDEMALTGLISAQLLHERFVRRFELARPVRSPEPMKVVLESALKSAARG